MSPAIVISEL